MSTLGWGWTSSPEQSFRLLLKWPKGSELTGPSWSSTETRRGWGIVLLGWGAFNLALETICLAHGEASLASPRALGSPGEVSLVLPDSALVALPDVRGMLASSLEAIWAFGKASLASPSARAVLASPAEALLALQDGACEIASPERQALA